MIADVGEVHGSYSMMMTLRHKFYDTECLVGSELKNMAKFEVVLGSLTKTLV